MTDTISRQAAIDAIMEYFPVDTINRPKYHAGKSLVQALTALPAVGGWLDIESAPRDGTNIIGICMTAQNPKPSQTWFQGNWDHYSLPDGKWHGGLSVWFPTHWQSMPNP